MASEMPQLTRSDIDCTQCYSISTFLSIERVIHMFMQNLSLYGETVIIPLLLNVNQSPLPGTEPEVLNP